MASLNKVFIMGNLTRDPEVRYIPSGTAVAELGVAVNESFRNREGQEVENTVFVDVIVWARQAETCGEYLSKGSPVFIEGRLQLDQWENKDGEKRNKLRVRADRVQFMGSPKRTAEYQDGGKSEEHPAPSSSQNPAPTPHAVAPSPAEELQHDDDNLPF
ncbi:MAG: single-stranded DNA-binding protein [Verrucomicrobia bacterium]|nr:single-stranded DNA-binding protein [Verrucomicrobiota bacterium]